MGCNRIRHDWSDLSCKHIKKKKKRTPCSQPEWFHPCGCFAPTLCVHIRRSWTHFRPGGPLNRCQEKILYAAIYKRGLAKHASVDIIKEVEITVASTLFSEVFLPTSNVHVKREIVADGVFFLKRDSALAIFGAYSKHPWKSWPLYYFICFFKISNHVIQLSSMIYCGLKERSRRGPDVEMLIMGKIKKEGSFCKFALWYSSWDG